MQKIAEDRCPGMAAVLGATLGEMVASSEMAAPLKMMATIPASVVCSFHIHAVFSFNYAELKNLKKKKFFFKIVKFMFRISYTIFLFIIIYIYI